MLAAKVREEIDAQGVPTFPRPKGIPENDVGMISKNGVGMKYVHPTNSKIEIRVMPGKPHSIYPCQQKPYVIQKLGEEAVDCWGKRVHPHAPEAHVSLNEFVYRTE